MRVARTLEREIRAGKFSRGDRLASENALVRRFSVSRNTVRKGLEELTRQGLITTRGGIGSFVTYDGASIDDALGWTMALSRSADVVETRVLRIQRAACPMASAFLDVTPDDFLHVDRIRLLEGGGVGISLERSRSPWRAAFDDVLANGLVDGSLNETFASIGLAIDHGEEWAEVMPALPEEDARAMGRAATEPMLRLRRVTRTAAGEVIEFVESLLDPRRFGLHLEFRR